MRHAAHRIEHSLELNCPLQKCYAALIDLESYPRFIPGFEIQHKGNEGVWQCSLKLAQNQKINWEMKIDGLKHENQAISWHTIRIADVAHNGAITLAPVNENITRFTFVLEYEPTAEFYQASQNSDTLEFTDKAFVESANQAILLAIENFQATLLFKAGSLQPKTDGGSCCR